MELKRRKVRHNLKEYDYGKNGFLISPSPYIPWQQNPIKFTSPGLSYDEMPSGYTKPKTAIGDPLSYDFGSLNKDIVQKPLDNGPDVNFDKKGGGVTGGQIAGIVGGVADIAQGVIGTQSAVKSAGEMMANAGTSNGNVGGVGYVRLNYIDESSEKDSLNGAGLSNTIGGVAKGAAAGAAFGPIGAGVGALVGGIANLFSWGSAKRKLKQRLENARQLTARINTGAQAGAMTTTLQNKYYSENGNDNGVLYANNGKDREL